MLEQPNKRFKKGSIFSTLLLATVCSTTTVWAQQKSDEKPPAISHPKTEPQTAPNSPETIKQTNDGKAFNYVEQMPRFKGDLSAWLSKHVTYPEKARKAHIEGRSIVKFVIAEDGSVISPEIIHSSGNAELDHEALVVMKKMPAWKPGKQNGKTVRVYFTLPISWKLN